MRKTIILTLVAALMFGFGILQPRPAQAVCGTFGCIKCMYSPTKCNQEPAPKPIDDVKDQG